MLLDSKIYLITFMENGKELVSHGIGDATLKTYCLLVDPVKDYKPKRDREGWYIDGPAARKVTMRLIVKNGQKWVEQIASMTQVELAHTLWELEGQFAVVVDDKQGVYYCGRQELITAYSAKGKKAESFLHLERRLFYEPGISEDTTPLP